MSDSGNQPPPQPNWFDTFEAADKGHVQNRGWNKPAGDVVQTIYNSYRELEKFQGVPPERLLRLPADAADTAGWKAVYGKLGAPNGPEGYDFSTVKNEDGSAMDEALASTLRNAAAAGNVPQAAALGLAQSVLKHLSDAKKQALAAGASNSAVELGLLKNNWQGNYDGNMFLAQRAAAMLGFSGEDMASFERMPGYAERMTKFLAAANRMGEATLHGGGGGSGGNTGAMTPEQATARLQELGRDQDWVRRRQSGDAAAMKEFVDLTTLMVPRRG